MFDVTIRCEVCHRKVTWGGGRPRARGLGTIREWWQMRQEAKTLVVVCPDCKAEWWARLREGRTE
jgi:hypothetical protein